MRVSNIFCIVNLIVTQLSVYLIFKNDGPTPYLFNASKKKRKFSVGHCLILVHVMFYNCV